MGETSKRPKFDETHPAKEVSKGGHMNIYVDNDTIVSREATVSNRCARHGLDAGAGVVCVVSAIPGIFYHNALIQPAEPRPAHEQNAVGHSGYRQWEVAV